MAQSQLQSIPTPTDSYDHAHCSLATVTSLRALLASFDATVESLSDTVIGHMDRLDSLTERARRCQDKVDRLRKHKDKDQESTGGNRNEGEGESNTVRTIKISCPDCYESVTKMDDIRFELRRQRINMKATTKNTTAPQTKIDYSNSNSNSNSNTTTCNNGNDNDNDNESGSNDNYVVRSSALARARSKSNAAVLSVLQREADGNFEGTAVTDIEHDDASNNTATATATEARPSDVWLDRASAFEETKSARLAVRLDAVPSLVVGTNNSVTIYAAHDDNTTNPNRNDNTVEEEEANYYKLGLRQYERDRSSSTCSAEGSSLRHTCSQQGSVTTDISSGTIGTNYSVLSHATASYRRRQRMQAAASSRRAAGAAPEQDNATNSMSSIIYHGINDRNAATNGINNTSLARQQAMTGSLPYLCELLHDTYGLGTLPNDFEGGNVFKEVHDVCDLTIYGTNQMAYGPQTSSSFNNDENLDANTSQKNVTDRVGKGYSNANGTEKTPILTTAGGAGSRDTTTSLSTKLNPTSYVPDALAKDAGLFQLPENLPL